MGRSKKTVLKIDAMTSNDIKNVIDGINGFKSKQGSLSKKIESNVLIENNNVVKGKLRVVEEICEMFPKLNKQKQKIVDRILHKPEKKTQLAWNCVEHKSKTFYVNGPKIIDKNINLVGIVYKGHYVFFDESKKMFDSISKLAKLISI